MQGAGVLAQGQLNTATRYYVHAGMSHLNSTSGCLLLNQESLLPSTKINMCESAVPIAGQFLHSMSSSNSSKYTLLHCGCCCQLQIGAVHAERGELELALSTYLEALEHSPENPEILTTLGLTFLRSVSNNTVCACSHQ
jgi:hypothetical protein